jgi:hypothetical protein
MPYGPTVKTFVGLLLFLVFSEDRTANYESHIGAPFGWVYDYLLMPTPLKLRFFDILMLIALLATGFRRDGKGRHIPPMKTSVLLVLATTIVWFVFGLMRGGQFRFASWQTYLILSTVLLTFAVAAVFRTAADYEYLGKWLLASAMYRALMCWISYFSWARLYVGQSGMYLTSHADTITWVTAILILLINALDRRSAAISFRNFVLIIFILGAIQWNSRRIAWVSLGMGLVVFYFLLPAGTAIKRRINRVAFGFIPVVVLYVVIGWGRQERIFLPLRSLSSVSTKEDGSTLARNAENLGLIATANYVNPATGTGWGNAYVYLTMKYDISGFELWRYVPHDSILGLLAFTGVLGFTGFWMAFPTAVFLNARVARLARDPRIRSVATIGAAQMVVSANQFFGDMGLFVPQSMYVIAVSYAMALRLPQQAGVWAAPKTGARAKQAT